MRAISAVAAAAILFAMAGEPAFADPTALSAAEWRGDLDQLAASIREVHPRPFSRVSEADFDKAVSDLRRDIPRLDDKEIIMRMAAIVGMQHDGHTRLALPRDYPAFGLEFGHGKQSEPAFQSLRFQQLPVAFEQFSDGVFVVAADEPHAQLIGRKLTAIGDVTAEEALEKLAPYTYAENRQLEGLMGADLLSLPEALTAAGVAADPEEISVTLAAPDGSTLALSLSPLAGDPHWRRARQNGGGRGPDDIIERKFWSTYIADGDIVYARIDEIGDAENVRLANFVMSAVETAEERNARLVIDLRNNFGGMGDLNRTLVLALAQSDALNRIGRTFIVTGPRTFSAAQMLVNDLERYTWALFVGEATGSHPDHFGDARKIRLENSGLTLRVSTLHWSSPMANDQRQATNPDIPAPWTSSTYFGGGDPALAAITAFDASKSYVDLVGAALERGDQYQVARYLLLARTSPQTYREDFSEDLLALGRRFEAQSRDDLASLAYRYGLAFFPHSSKLAAALAGLQKQVAG